MQLIPAFGSGRHGAIRAALMGAAWLLFAVAGTSSARVAPLAPDVAVAAWRWPLDGPPHVTRRFDPPDTPYGAGHRGVDLAGRPGMVVRAAGAGRVGFAGVLAGRGVVTVLHAGGLKTTYEPVHASVHAGATVAIGAVLGRLEPGHPGCPVAACLHWGLLRGASYLDPLSLVGVARVRLLPLADPTTDTDSAAAVLSRPSGKSGPFGKSGSIRDTGPVREIGSGRDIRSGREIEPVREISAVRLMPPQARGCACW